MELPVVISFLALACSVLQFFLNVKKENSNNIRDSTSNVTRIFVKLETISDLLSELKVELKHINKELEEHNTRITRLETEIQIIRGD